MGTMHQITSVNVYGHRDIPATFLLKWRTALSLLVSLEKRKDTISIMTGSPAGEPWGYHSKCRLAHDNHNGQGGQPVRV